jgi:hypothetical protein
MEQGTDSEAGWEHRPPAADSHHSVPTIPAIPYIFLKRRNQNKYINK